MMEDSLDSHHFAKPLNYTADLEPHLQRIFSQSYDLQPFGLFRQNVAR